MVLPMAVVLVTGLPFMGHGSLVETVRGEVVASRIEDTLDMVWFVNWVMEVDLLEAFRDDVPNAVVKPIEEGRVVVVNGNAACLKKGGGNH
jgi:hypothetical protein